MIRFVGNATAVAMIVAGNAWADPINLTDAQLGQVVAGREFIVTRQVSDQTGRAPVIDSNLVNAWGLSQAPGGPLWVSNNGTDTSTLYDANSFAKIPLTVSVPGAPTGTTFVGIDGAFNISSGGVSGRTVFAFATEDGRIEGWNPTVSATQALVAVNESASGSIFKGLTLGTSDAGPRLFAADFAHGVVSMYDTSFNKVGSFTDPHLPADYTPFNVQNLDGQIYVTFAKREPGAADETAGRGLGFVDVFDTSGHLVKRLIQEGKLNAPWGLAIAPKTFGKFAGALLVGNFGDGDINAYDVKTGKFLGAVRDEHHQISIDGLWALHTGPNGTITFSAGPDDESHGLIGSIAARHAGFDHDEVIGLNEMRGH